MELVFEILSYAKMAPSADNSQPGKYRLCDDGFTVNYAADRVAGKTFEPMAPATLLAMGAIQENISQGAVALGAHIDISRWPSNNATETEYLKVSCPNNKPVPGANQARLEAILNRHTNRNGYRRSRVPDVLAASVASSRQGAARVLWAEGGRVSVLAGLVQRASENRFRTKVLHEWLAHSLRFDGGDSGFGEGLDVNTLALPFGGKAAMRFIEPWARMKALNRVGAYRMMALVEALPVRRAPAVVAIISPNGNDDLMDAGMLMERIWIKLNEAGLAVQPYYVVADQLHRRREGILSPEFDTSVNEMSDQCRDLFDLRPEEQLQIMFRVGYAKKKAIRSKRLRDSTLIVR